MSKSEDGRRKYFFTMTEPKKEKKEETEVTEGGVRRSISGKPRGLWGLIGDDIAAKCGVTCCHCHPCGLEAHPLRHPATQSASYSSCREPEQSSLQVRKWHSVRLAWTV